METTSVPYQVRFNKTSSGELLLELTGSWTLGAAIPSVAEAEQEIEAKQPIQAVAFDAAGLTDWDSGLLVFVLGTVRYCALHRIAVDQQGLPEGVQRLLRLALAVPEKEDARRQACIIVAAGIAEAP
jgi:phospholipid/cholesterol/gamma-HCH transport system permease protein